MAESYAPVRALQRLPAVGPAFAQDLLLLGFTDPEQLKDQDADALFTRLEALSGKQDPCVLDTLRCVVYAASTPHPEPDKLKWWTWSRLRKCGAIPGVPGR